MAITESKVFDGELTTEQMYNSFEVSNTFQGEVVSIALSPLEGYEYRSNWKKIGWASLLIETSPEVFQLFKSQILLRVPRQVIDWGVEQYAYRLLLSFVPWLPPSRLEVWAVGGFPDFNEASPLNPLEVQQQFSPPFPAGVSLAAFSLVRLSGGVLEPSDCRDVDRAYTNVGIVTTSVLAGSSSQVLVEGTVQNAVWTWLVDVPVWMGESGSLTQSPPTSGILQQVGVAISPDKINVELQEPIQL